MQKLKQIPSWSGVTVTAQSNKTTSAAYRPAVSR